MPKKAWLFSALATAALALASGAAAKPAAPGSIVFTSDRANGERELYVVNRDGSDLHRLTFNSLFERQAAWSPDRSRIAFSARDASGNWDLYTIDSSGGDLQRLTTDPGRDDSPQWTPDGRIV
jgi:TolB protein